MSVSISRTPTFDVKGIYEEGEFKPKLIRMNVTQQKGKETVGKKTFEIENIWISSIEFNPPLKPVKDSSKEEVPNDQEEYVNPFINHLPIKHLKWFGTFKIPNKCEYLSEHTSDVCLKFKDLKWFEKKKKKIRFLKINVDYIDEDQKSSTTVSSNLKIFGLKRLLSKLLQKKVNREYSEYILSCNGLILEDKLTIEDCGLKDDVTIVVRLNPEDSASSESLQSGTMGTYQNIPKFNQLFEVLTKNKDIVCFIETNDKKRATGFLIGMNLIMTNAHVIDSSEKCKGAKATFFFYEKGEISNLFAVFLDEVLYATRFGGDWDTVTGERLDFSIIRFKTDNLNEEDKKRLLKITRVAIEFYKSNKDYQGILPPKKICIKNTRANIIQYPNTSTVKEIAFRETALKAPASTELLHYKSGTESGSSGSPVMDDEGRFIGLHKGICTNVQSKLVDRIFDLLKELKIIPEYCKPELQKNGEYQKDSQKYSDFKHSKAKGDKEDVNLEVFYKGVSRGKCRYKNSDKYFDLKTLIRNKIISSTEENEKIIDEIITDFILNFFKKLKCNNIKEIRKHLNCRVAVLASRIIDHIEHINDQEIVDEIHKAQNLEEIAKEEDLLNNLKPIHDVPDSKPDQRQWWVIGNKWIWGSVVIAVGGVFSFWVIRRLIK